MSNICVLKVEGSKQEKVMELAGQLGKAIGGTCFIVPLDVTISLGETALRELRQYRDQLNLILDEVKK